MKALALGLGIAIAAAPAAYGCNSELFLIEDWRVEAEPDGRNIRTVIDVDVTYVGDRAYRMIHGAVLLSDALGNALNTVQMERDETITPGNAVTMSGRFLGSKSRISTIDPDDVIAETCVWSITYDDGTVERFD